MILPPRPGPDNDPLRKRLAVIAQNLRDLSSRDAIVVTAANQRLGELTPSTADLLELLDDRDQFIRSGAAQCLRFTEGDEIPRVVEALRGIVHVSNDRVVEAALGSLGYLRATEAVDDIREFLAEPNARVVHAAIYALGRLGLPEEGRYLVRFVAAPEHHLVISTLNALVQLRYLPAIPALLDRLRKSLGAVRRTRQQFELPRKLIHTLVTLRAREAVPVLVQIAQEEVGIRGLAVQALIDLRAAEAAPPLVPLLARLVDSPHEERLCTGLLNLMLTVDYHFALPEVRRFLNHRLPSVRSVALKVLAAWQDRESAESIRALCHNDPSAFVRPGALAALARLLGAEALPDFRALCNDSNPLVRETVARALGRLRPLPEEGRALLQTLLADPAAARTAATALALNDGPPAEEPPLVLPVPPSGEVLPQALRSQAHCLGLFLRHWQGHLAGVSARGHAGANELLRAVGLLLHHLDSNEPIEHQARAA
jgi:HEAT repeat protein